MFRKTGRAPLSLALTCLALSGLLVSALSAASDSSGGEIILFPSSIHPLPGKLNSVPVFNSNSPEVVQQEGILLSTLSGEGKTNPAAHLNYKFKDRFDIFFHHIAKGSTAPPNLTTLYVGLILYNPGKKPIKVQALQAASYLSQPDAPFVPLPAAVKDPDGKIFSGPGDRAMSDILRGRTTLSVPPEIKLVPGKFALLASMPIPVRTLTPPLNGRSGLIQLRSSGELQVASLGMFAKLTPDGSERAPTLEEWTELARTGALAGPRDVAGTPANATPFRYGRVAGVSVGNEWTAQVVDADQETLSVPEPGHSISYPVSSVDKGTFGVEQVQSAPLAVRYSDTAYRAHGNYAVRYNIAIPMRNAASEPRTVQVLLQTPLKKDSPEPGLYFNARPNNRMFFRGAVRVSCVSQGEPQWTYWHLAQSQGEQGQPLCEIRLEPGQKATARLEFLYPPDATPPQMLTIRSAADQTCP